MDLSTKHPFFTTAAEVKQACSELSKQLQLSYFAYARVYDDGFAYVLSDRPEVGEFLISKEMQVASSIPHAILKREFFYAVSNEGYFKEILDYFRLFSCLEYILRKEGCYDVFSIASQSKDHDMINLYLNHLPLLKRFCHDFLKNLERPLILSANNKIFLPEKMRPNFGGLQENELKEKRIDIDTSIIKKYKLSIRESEVLSLVAHGYTAKQMACKLNLGQRTIESHLNKLKLKTGCYYKSEFMDKVLILSP